MRKLAPVLLGLLVFVGLLVGLYVAMQDGGGGGEPLPEAPKLDEDEGERRAAILSAFQGPPEPLEGPHADAIRALLGAVFDAFNEADAEALADHFDVRMTLALVRDRGMMPPDLEAHLESNPRQIDAFAQRYLRAIVQDSGIGIMEPPVISSIRYIRGDEAAVVYTRHRDSYGWNKMRWWILREGSRWEVYDWEDLSMGIRQSSALGSGMQARAQGSISREAFRRTMQASYAMQEATVEGRLEDALEHAERIDVSALPEALRPAMLLVQAQIHLDRRDGERAEALLDSVEATGAETPLLTYSRAQLHLLREEPDAAIAAIERYESFLGADADTWTLRSDAHHLKGEDAEAERLAMRALEEDPRNLGAVLSLVVALPSERLDEVAPHFQRLEAPVESFEAMAGYLRQEGEEAALAALIRAFNTQNPGREDITRPYRSNE